MEEKYKTKMSGRKLPNQVICVGELAIFSSKMDGLFSSTKRQFINTSHIDEQFFLSFLEYPKTLIKEKCVQRKKGPEHLMDIKGPRSRGHRCQGVRGSGTCVRTCMRAYRPGW